jgi:hypothetical protein
MKQEKREPTGKKIARWLFLEMKALHETCPNIMKEKIPAGWPIFVLAFGTHETLTKKC